MCIRVRYVPRAEITDPWDANQRIITIPLELTATAVFAIQAVRVVLLELAIPQGPLDASCWCGEPIEVFPESPQQHRKYEVIHLGA